MIIEFYDHHFSFDQKTVLLGYMDTNHSYFEIINLIILLTKKEIYFQKFIRPTERINFIAFINHLKYIKNIEVKIAERNGKIHEHEKKWKNLFL